MDCCLGVGMVVVGMMLWWYGVVGEYVIWMMFDL